MHGCTFRNVKLTGEIGDNASFDGCFLQDVTEFTGRARNCKFLGDIYFKSPSTHVCILDDCTGVRRQGATFHLYDSTQNFAGWTGYLNLRDKTGIQETNVNLNPGFVDVDSSCISGSILVVGEGSVVAAGSVVSGSVKDHLFVRGNPAVPIATLTAPITV